MSLPSYGFAADGVEYNRAGAFYLASGGTGGQTVPADLTVKGNLEVQGATHLVGAVACDSTVTATVGAGKSVALVSAGGPPGLASTVYTNNSIVGAIGLDSVGTMVVGFGPSSRPVTIPGTLTVTGAGGGSGVSGGLTVDVLGCPSITGGASTPAGFPFGLTSPGSVSAGVLQGFNQTRGFGANVSDYVTDYPFTYAGTPLVLGGVIAGAGPNFTVTITMPADLTTNAAYNGRTILDGILQFSGGSTRNVTIVVNNSAGTQLFFSNVAAVTIGATSCLVKIIKVPSSAVTPIGLLYDVSAGAGISV